jgi:hypothetical protein
LPEALRDYHYPKVYADFLSEVADHEMRVMHDDGVYRHLRFAAPGTRMWSFDIITYPGHLVTTGDIADGYSFNREYDMIPWFLSGVGRAPGHINASYWAQKLTGYRDVKVFDEATAKRSVRDEALQQLDNLIYDFDDNLAPDLDEDELAAALTALQDAAREFLTAVEEQVVDDAYEINDLMRALSRFEHNGITFEDYYELSTREYDYHFLLACHAILWGLQKYRAELATGEFELPITERDEPISRHIVLRYMRRNECSFEVAMTHYRRNGYDTSQVGSSPLDPGKLDGLIADLAGYLEPALYVEVPF